MIDKTAQQNEINNRNMLSRQGSQRGTVLVAENEEAEETNSNLTKSCCG